MLILISILIYSGYFYMISVVDITTIQLHSRKPELRTSPACGVSNG